MNCPKCGYQQNDGLECRRCGIVFSRYHAGPPLMPHVKQGHSALRTALAYFRRGYRVFRCISLAILVLSIVLMLRASKPPRIVVSPDSAQMAEGKITEFQSAVKQGINRELSLEEPEINGWLSTNLALKKPESASPVAAQNPESLVSLAKIATGGQTSREASLRQVQSSIRDIKVALQGDQIHLYAMFDFHGMDLSLELDGRLLAQDGYLRLEPTGGKLGSLPLLVGTLRAVTTRLFDSPDNKEKFRLPSYIQDIAVENGTLIVNSR